MKLLDLDRIFDNDRPPRRSADRAITAAPPDPAVLPLDVGLDDLPEDWFHVWGERAAIMEFDYGTTREYAEAYSLRDVLEQMKKAGELHRLKTNN